MGAVVRTENLTRRFGKLTAVDHLNLEVAQGEIFGLVGPDGAGKTTTLRLLAGLLDPTEGQAFVAGCDVRQDLGRVKDSIGYMAQRFGFYADLTVQENMHFYADLFGIGRADRTELAGRLLKMTRMQPFRDRQAQRLSGGMKQKLALMCALLHRPQVLFLDEPTNGVDPVSRRDFWTIIYELVKDGMTVVVTTAYLDEAERCNRVGLMHEGRLIRCQAPDVLRRRFELPCYDAEMPDLRSGKDFLEQCGGVASVEPAGASLHLFLFPSQTSAQTLEKALASAGLGPARLRPIDPSLEDVFIASIRRERERRI
ncbi:MAG: ABC transporter ATP-binding protein [Acidobacteria bacterium]|nr:ABC transporter ATP-binding protein [Acidobacteriota bacterium]